MNAQLNSLLTKKMDRKDFLKHVGVGFVAITGMSAIVKTLAPMTTNTGMSAAPAGVSTSVSRGYGTSAYGGNKLG